MSTTDQPPKHKRRWYQFSLWTLLVVMTLFTVAFAGWVQYMRQRAQENRERVAAAEDAVAAIEKLGGVVTSAYEDLRPQTWLEEQFDDPGGPDDPVGVLDVAKMSITGTHFTDTSLKHAKGLTRLQHLSLIGTKVTDTGLEHLMGLTSLTHLHIGPSWATLEKSQNVTDAGLEHLKGLTNLQSLSLENTKVTDECVKKLQQALPDCEISR